MDFRQVWIVVVFLVGGWLCAYVAKRWYFLNHDDARRARWVFYGVWVAFIVFGIAFFLTRAT